MSKGQFKIQKIMDVGAGHFIVHSLTIGLFEIVNMAQISKDEKDTINSMNLKIADYLIKAERIGFDICSSIEEAYTKLKQEGVKTQSNERCVDVPSARDLDKICDFLKYGKQALQELVKIFNLFLQSKVSGPRFDKLYEKVCSADGYGKDDPIAIALKKDHDDWLKKFIVLRNTDEHPENRLPKGKQLYYDFDITWSDSDKKWIVRFPHFYEGTSINELVKTSIHNIFTFVEEMNILFLQKKMPGIVQILKVSEDQKDKYGGRRFVLDIKEPYRKGLR